MGAGETPPPPKPQSQKEPEAPPRSQRGAEAPIARVDKSSLVTVSTRARGSRIKMADVAIIGSALAIIALSIAALVWVLK
jgi:hypothetical protein